jgi:hypothetical protein
MQNYFIRKYSVATTYLQNSTTTVLYAKFNPVIKIHLVK